MFAILLFATPFILLRNFLQEAIGSVSRFSFGILGMEIPFVVAIGIILAIALVIALRRYITIYRVLAVAAVVLMVALAQKSTDYYFNHKFYDLQQNWHYIAYGLFAFMMFRALKTEESSGIEDYPVDFYRGALYLDARRGRSDVHVEPSI